MEMLMVPKDWVKRVINMLSYFTGAVESFEIVQYKNIKELIEEGEEYLND